MSHLLSAAFVLGSMVFVWRSFYGMRIKAARPLKGRGRDRFEKPVSKMSQELR